MGADVLESVRVAAFPCDSGVLYAAIVRSYDKKDGRSDSRERVGAFGTHAQCMRWVFRGIGGILSGLLQGPNGSTLSPIEYLVRWKTAFRNPSQLADQSLMIHADRSIGGIYSTLDDPEKATALLRKLRAAGFEAIAEQLEHGCNVSFSLDANAELAEVVIGDTSGVDLAPWRVGLSPVDDGSLHRELAPVEPPRGPATVHAPALRWYTFDGFEKICFTDDATLGPLIGWDYAIKEALILHYAQNAEILEGRGEEVLCEVCAAMDALPIPPPLGCDLRCSLVDEAALNDHWDKEDWRRVSDKLRMIGRSTSDFSVGDAVEADCIRSVGALARHGFCSIHEPQSAWSKVA